MAENQAADPVTGNQGAEGTGGQGGSVLTVVDQAATIKGAPVVDGSGAASEKPPKQFIAQLSKDLWFNESIGKFDGFDPLARAYIELEGKLGKAVVIPEGTASDEEKASYRKKMGVPDKPEDYKLDKVELPEGMKPDEQRIKQILDIAHKHYVPQAAVNEIIKTYLITFAKDVADGMKIVKTTREEATAKLRNELKGDYEPAMTMKDRAFKYLAGQGEEGVALAKLLDDTGVGNHPLFVKMFSRIGKSIGDHVFVDGGHGTPEAAPTSGPRTDEQLAAALWPEKK